MAEIGVAVHTYLQSQPKVTALVGSRGYPNNAPEDATSTLYVYSVISSTEEKHLAGNGISGVGVSRVQLDVYSNNYADATEAAKQIRLAMLTTTPVTMGKLCVDKIVKENEFDSSEKPVDGGDGWRHRVTLDFLLTHDVSTS